MNKKMIILMLCGLFLISCQYNDMGSIPICSYENLMIQSIGSSSEKDSNHLSEEEKVSSEHSPHEKSNSGPQIPS